MCHRSAQSLPTYANKLLQARDFSQELLTRPGDPLDASIPCLFAILGIIFFLHQKIVFISNCNWVDRFPFHRIVNLL